MNSASRFFGFILAPILAFALGYHVANNNMLGEKHIIINQEDNLPNDQNLTALNHLLTKGIKIDLIQEMLTIIEEKYVDPDKINSEEITYGLAKGLIFSLDDPFSSYMTPGESDDFQETLDGSLEGIGAELTTKHGNIIVVSPLRDSPAIKAGLLPHDIIVKVNDEEVADLSLDQVVQKIRGEPGSIVKITIARKNLDELIDLDIVRQKIVVESVSLEMIGDIAVLEVNQFGTNTKVEFEKYLDQAINNNPIGIVLDMRFNSGGFLDKARDIVSCFVENKKVAIIKSRPPDTENIFTIGNLKTELPLVILQNRGSASASEIVAGALQDYERAKIIGSNSFGKGTVQEVVPLKNGGNLRLTIAKWLTPQGRDINEIGVTPDYLIENSVDDFENDLDPQMDAAIRLLKGEDPIIKIDPEPVVESQE